MSNISFPTFPIHLSDEEFGREFRKFYDGQWNETLREMLIPCIEAFQHSGPSIFEKIKEKARAKGLNPDDFIKKT